MRLVVMPFAASLALIPVAHAFDASLDTTFGQAGVSLHDESTFAAGYDKLFEIGKRPGGGYVALSSRQVSNGDELAFLMRLSASGAPLGETQLPMPSLYVGGAAVDPQGRMLIASIAFLPNNRRGVRVERRLDSGALDLAFGGGDGFVVLDEPDHNIDAVAVSVDPLRVAIAGYALAVGGVAGTDTKSFAALLDLAGAPDVAFGDNGIAVVDVSPSNNEGVSAVTTSPSGQPLLCGFVSAAPFSSDASITRLLPDGLPDGSFGVGGTAVYDTSMPGEVWGELCRDIGFHPGNGRLHASVERRLGGPIRGGVRVLTFTESGSFDGNVPDVQVSEGDYPGAVELAFDAEGRVLLAASLKDLGGNTDVYVIRLLELSLFPDGDFGTGGSESYPVFAPGAIRRDAEEVAALLVDKGRIVVGSNHGEAPADNLWAVQRLEGTALFASGFE